MASDSGEILIRVRPAETMADLDLALIRERGARLEDWNAELVDSRLGDAPYVTVVARPHTRDEQSWRELREAFSDLPRMRANVLLESLREEPIEAFRRFPEREP